MSASPLSSRRAGSWTLVLAAAVVGGAYLRLDQILIQVLIDDEWHAVHQVLNQSPSGMFFDHILDAGRAIPVLGPTVNY